MTTRFNGHVPEDLLASFVEGDLDESVAEHIAEHIDLCPACATRAATMEPLAAAFAAVPDPVAPAGLAEAVLAKLEEPERERGPSLEVAIGSVLLAAAAFLTILGGHPSESFLRIGKLAGGFSRAAGPLTESAAPPLVAVAFLLLVGALLARSVRILSLDRRAT